MLYKGINLRKATIHDFTSDKKILIDEFGIEESKEEFNKHLSVQTWIMDLLGYAELTKYKDLENAVFKVFKKELDTFGFE